MAKKMLFAAALAVLVVAGSHILSLAATCSPSRADILSGQRGTPTCSPSRADILSGQVSP